MALNNSISKISFEHSGKMQTALPTEPLQHPTIIVFFGDLISDQIEKIKTELCSKWQNGNNICIFHFYNKKPYIDSNICSVDISEFVDMSTDAIQTRKNFADNHNFIKKINKVISEKLSHIFNIRYLNSQLAYCTVITNVDDPSNYISAEIMSIVKAHLLLDGVANVFINGIHLFTEDISNTNAGSIRKQMLLLYENWKADFQADLFHDGSDQPLKPLAMRGLYEKIYFLDEYDSDLFKYTNVNDRCYIVSDIIYSYLFSHDFPGYFKTVGLLPGEISMDYLILQTICELNTSATKKMETLLKNNMGYDGTLRHIQTSIEDICDKMYSRIRSSLAGNIVRMPFKPNDIAGLNIEDAENRVFGNAISAKMDFLVQQNNTSFNISQEIINEIEQINNLEVLQNILDNSRHIVSNIITQPLQQKEIDYVESHGNNPTAFGDMLEQEIIQKIYDEKISELKMKTKTNLYKQIIEKCESQIDIISQYQTAFSEFDQMTKQQKILSENSWSQFEDKSTSQEIQQLILENDDILDYMIIAAKAQREGNYDSITKYVYETYAVRLKSTKIRDSISLKELPVLCRLRRPVPDEFSELTIKTGINAGKRLKSVNLQTDEIVFFERILQ